MSKKSKKNNNDGRGSAEERKKPQSGDEEGTPKLGKKEYEAELFKLQVELVKLQEWVKKTGACIVILFEGRDAARAASSSAFWNG